MNCNLHLGSKINKSLEYNFMNVFMYCYGLNVSPPTPQNTYVKITPKVMVLGGGAFGKCLGHDGGALTSGISVLIKEASGRSLPLPLCEDTVRSFLSL